MFKDKQMILNPELNKLIAELGHFDEIVICDAGLPIPKNVNTKIIDLSIVQGLPKFIDVFEIIINNLAYEKIILAKEIQEKNSFINKLIKQKSSSLEYATHEDFKKMSLKSKAFIRTGEATPYANAIIVSGVNF